MKGEEKSFTTVWLTLRQRTLHYETYFMPAPEENVEACYEFLLRLNQIWRQHENSIGARVLRPPRKFDRQSRAISDACNDRQPAADGFGRGRDDALVLGQF